jgi:predicted naringenin-chalcone synthase
MGGMGGKRGSRMGMDKGNPPTNRNQENVADVIGFRLAQLQEDLKLTREQEPAWAAYEERTLALAADVARERTRVQAAVSVNAMEQVNHAVDIARDRLTAWEDIATAAKNLYATLTPQQKSLVDQKFPSIVSALEPGGSITTAVRP